MIDASMTNSSPYHDKSILFEGNDIIVRQSMSKESDTIIYSFNGFSTREDFSIGFGEGFFDKNGYSSIMFIPKRNIWWQSKEIDTAIKVIDVDAKEKYAHRVAYGASMGGYGALLFATQLKSTQVLACSPQTCISDAEYPMHIHWRKALLGVKIIRDDIPDCIDNGINVSVLYDPLRRWDRKHVSRLRSFESLKTFAVPMSGHFSLEYLRDAGLIGSLVPKLMQNSITPGSFRSIVRATRCDGAVYEKTFREMAVKSGRRSNIIEKFGRRPITGR